MLIKERFGALLTEYAEAERKTEITRQVLVERREFDAYAAFRRITSELYGGITPTELQGFLSELGVAHTQEELDLLFIHLDFDGDGLVSWPEFLDSILSREHHNNFQYGILTTFTMELEHSLARVYEQELENEKDLEKHRRLIFDVTDLKEGKLFDEVDTDTKGWISVQDVHTFLKSYSPNVDFTVAERAFRRIDEDNDDRILYDEFLRSVRPIYTYANFEHYVPASGKEISPTKIMMYTHEPSPLRKGLRSTRDTKSKKVSTLKTDPDWEERKNLPTKKGQVALQQTKESYEKIGLEKPHSPTKIHDKNQFGGHNNHSWWFDNYRGSYSAYGQPSKETGHNGQFGMSGMGSMNGGWGGMGAMSMYGGMGGPGMYGGMGGPGMYGGMGGPGMYGGMGGGPGMSGGCGYNHPNAVWPYNSGSSLNGGKFGDPYRQVSGNRVDRSAVHEEMVKSRLQMSPDRETTLRTRAAEVDASKSRRPYFDQFGGSFVGQQNSLHRSFGSPDVWQCDNLRRSTLQPITNEEKLNESQVALSPTKFTGTLETTNTNALEKSELMTDAKQADPECRGRFFTNVKAILSDFRKLEAKRKNLAMRFDFCLTEIFNQIDTSNTGYMTLNNFDEYAKKSGILMNREDWAVVVDRFDRDKDNCLNFAEFTQIFAPYTPEYRKTMTNRSQTQVSTFYQYTIQTKKLLKDLLFSVVQMLENFEAMKYGITNGLVANSNELFDELDSKKDGFVTQTEFKDYFAENGVKMSAHLAALLFESFDKDADGRISFGEFHTPNKRAAEIRQG